MRRIILVLTIALLMIAIVANSATFSAAQEETFGCHDVSVDGPSDDFFVPNEDQGDRGLCERGTEAFFAKTDENANANEKAPVTEQPCDPEVEFCED